jgi:hypothetical protein
VIPRTDARWDDDVHRAAHWLGDAWSEGLAVLGVDASVHRGRLVRTAWSSLVCFAGLGPGEVTVDGAKVIGLSQRRTRDAARFQCIALAGWDPAATVDLLALDDGTRAEGAAALAAVGAGVPGGATGLARLERAFLAALAGR